MERLCPLRGFSHPFILKIGFQVQAPVAPFDALLMAMAIRCPYAARTLR